MSDDPSRLPDEAAPVLIDQMFDLWIEPELERSGSRLRRDEVHAALIVMSPTEGVSVHINDEATFVADARAARPIAEGEAVSMSDFTEILGIRPVNIDPDAGWVGFAEVGDARFVAFDFRRNRKRARRLLALAIEYLETARSALGLRRFGPAIENAFAAAELGVTAQLLLMDDAPTKDHPGKRRWFKGWTELGNAPEAHSRAIAGLASLRKRARYGDGVLDADEGVITRLVGDVGDLVTFAYERVEEGVRPESLR